MIVRDGRTLFAGPGLPGRQLEGTATAAFPGGHVSVRDHTSPERASPLELTLVLAAVVALLLLAATMITRPVRQPVERAIATADRLAGETGDANPCRARARC